MRRCGAPKPAAEVLVAWRGDVPAGFALFFHNYSTFLGRRGIWLEDLFVRPAFRRQGCARASAASGCRARDRARLRPVRVVGARLECRRDRFLPRPGCDGPARLAHRPRRRAGPGGTCHRHARRRRRRLKTGWLPAPWRVDQMRRRPRGRPLRNCLRYHREGRAAMRLSAILTLCMLLAACATAPVAPPPTSLFNDQLFRPPSERISADDVFAVSDAMKRFLNTELAGQINARGLQQGFVDALFTKEPAQARIRLGDDAECGAGVRRACRQLPVSGDHDGRAREGDRPAGPVPQRLRGRHLEPQRRRLLLHRPRQPGARQARDRGRIRARRRRRDHDRFSSAGRRPAARGH